MTDIFERNMSMFIGSGATYDAHQQLGTLEKMVRSLATMTRLQADVTCLTKVVGVWQGERENTAEVETYGDAADVLSVAAKVAYLGDQDCVMVSATYRPGDEDYAGHGRYSRVILTGDETPDGYTIYPDGERWTYVPDPDGYHSVWFVPPATPAEVYA